MMVIIGLAAGIVGAEEPGAGNGAEEPGAGFRGGKSEDPRARSRESGARSRESGVRSQESGARC